MGKVTTFWLRKRTQLCVKFLWEVLLADHAPLHFSRPVCAFLNRDFPDHCILLLFVDHSTKYVLVLDSYRLLIFSFRPGGKHRHVST
jgi:hypothetical protein